ncbi:hypothetical protein E4U55_001418 [Claviceps digitariae]|nr:hypothetical protein E4U55_001418 [Claviceps digitariae]
MTAHNIASLSFIQSIDLPRLRQVSVFEDFNERCIRHLRTLNDPDEMEFPERLPPRHRNEELAKAIVRNSSKLEYLEHLSVAFMVDAGVFLRHCQQSWTWSRLRFLSLTARPLHEEAQADKISTLLTNAAFAAQGMPKLDRMLLWHAAEGEGCSFEYRRTERAVIWKALWDLKLSARALEAWDEVVSSHYSSSSGIRVIKHILGCKVPRSHAEGMRMLELPPGIVDPISLFQMQDEASWDLKYRLKSPRTSG